MNPGSYRLRNVETLRPLRFAANFARVPWALFWLATMTAAGAAAAMIAFWAFRRAFLPAEHASSSSVSISDAASDRLPGQLH